jgi:hypothetical protein
MFKVYVHFRFLTHSGTLYQVEEQMGRLWVTKVVDASDPDWGSAPRHMVCASDTFIRRPVEGERYVVRCDGAQVLSTSPVRDVFYPRRMADAQG